MSQDQVLQCNYISIDIAGLMDVWLHSEMALRPRTVSQVERSRFRTSALLSLTPTPERSPCSARLWTSGSNWFIVWYICERLICLLIGLWACKAVHKY